MDAQRTSVLLFGVLLVLVLVLLCVVSGSSAISNSGGNEAFDDPTYLSVLNVTSAHRPLSVCIPEALAPCTVPIQALTSIKAPLTPAVQQEGSCDLYCTDMISAWLLNSGSQRDNVVAACPRNDVVLTLTACLGHGNIPHTPPTSSGISLHDLVMAGDTIACAGPLEQRMVLDMCSCASLHILTAPIPEKGVGTRTVAYMRPLGNSDVELAQHRPNAVNVNLPKIDPAIFAVRQPLAKLAGTTVSATSVLMGGSSLTDDPRVLAAVSALTGVDPMWALAELNYASKYLTLLPSTRDLLRPIDAVAKTRSGSEALTDESYGISTVSVLREGFFAPPQTFPAMTLVSYDPIDAYMTSTTRDGMCRVLEVRHPYIGAARMRLGDRVVLRMQAIKKHDGEYIVQALPHKDRGTVLVTWFEVTYDAITFTDVKAVRLVDRGNPAPVVMRALVGAMQRGDLWPNAQLHMGDPVLMRNLRNTDGSTGVWTRVTELHGTSVTLEAAAGTHPHTAASDGSCVTSPTTEIKSVCLAEGGLWDAPCTADDQCPFFQKNKRYPNYRGGCLESGWCEMPLGVQQPSFRTAVGEPVCHEGVGEPCTDIAFPLDEYERSVFTIAPA